MAEVEEPQFNSLAERIAALNKQKNFSSTPTPSAPARASSSASTATTQGHRPPPPPPAKKIQSPPPVPRPAVRNGATPVPGATPPPLPRRASQPAQSSLAVVPSHRMPQRHVSAQHLQEPSNAVARRGSSESVGSHQSLTSPGSMSLSRVSSRTSQSSLGGDQALRKLPPAFGTAKLPPLPPTKREREAKEREEREAAQKEAASREATRREAIERREAERQEAEEREDAEAPRLPSRPAGRPPPAMPRRPAIQSNEPDEDDVGPRLPRRPAARKAPEPEDEPTPQLPRRPTATRAPQPAEEDGSGPRLPPRPRPSAQAREQSEDRPSRPTLPTRQPTSAGAAKSILDLGFNNEARNQAKRLASQDSRKPWEPIKLVDNDRRRDDDGDDDDGRPPPLPMMSRPSRAQVEAVFRGGGNRSNGNSDNSGNYGNHDNYGRNGNNHNNGYNENNRNGQRRGPSADGYPGSGDPNFYPKRSEDEECLLCRDFSGPDAAAEQFPRQSLPKRNTVAYLAHNMCDQFESQTDKARAIFKWCHYNIVYDVDGFFNNCVPRGLSISEQIFSGKAVCEGYGKIYQAVAEAAGLECILVTGHGKGYGFDHVKPGDPIPKAKPDGHAWNAVRIDGGEWKLLDSCWGAGALMDGKYNQRFAPSEFCKSNEEFGLTHFPENPNYFFRADGRRPSWAEYVVDKEKSDPIILYSNSPQSGITQAAIEPQSIEIPVHDGRPDDIIRFRWGRFCRHWDPKKHGDGKVPYQMLLKVNNPEDEQSEGFLEIRYDNKRHTWWIDVPRRLLGQPGEKVYCYCFTTKNGEDQRGARYGDFLMAKGRTSMSWGCVCAWTLV